MKLLLTIHEEDIDPKSVAHTGTYEEREAARAVVLTPSREVYLLNVSLFNYHKLPGGGIEDGEEIADALKREIMEEIGCKAEVVAELGKVVEFRDFIGLKQTSYCYVAMQMGEQGESNLEPGELAEGMYEVKTRNLDEAIGILERDRATNLEGEFIRTRDLAILKAAKAAGEIDK